ncbi:MAG: DUF1799 domain-containing protein [Solidesulfovibrio sp.]
MLREAPGAARGRAGGGEKKLSSLGEWLAEKGRTSCEDCRRAYAPTRWDTPADKERKRDGPPCSTCRPEVRPGNAEAYAIWARCSGQLIFAGMGQAVDINILAVMGLMDRIGIPFEEQDELLMKVQMLSGIVLGEQAKRNKAERDAEKGKK